MPRKPHSSPSAERIRSVCAGRHELRIALPDARAGRARRWRRPRASAPVDRRRAPGCPRAKATWRRARPPCAARRAGSRPRSPRPAASGRPAGTSALPRAIPYSVRNRQANTSAGPMSFCRKKKTSESATRPAPAACTPPAEYRRRAVSAASDRRGSRARGAAHPSAREISRQEKAPAARG